MSIPPGFWLTPTPAPARSSGAGVWASRAVTGVIGSSASLDEEAPPTFAGAKIDPAD
jgi:hypothetical protein